MLSKPLANRNLRRFLGYSATMIFATGFMGQFAWFYLFDVVGLEEHRRLATRAAARYLAAHVYSNVQQTVLMPLRQLGRLGRLSYNVVKRSPHGPR